ncbi:MAG: Hydrolase, NUDIX family [Parcubacteria group bacterium GW2011_GWA2_36_10]|nr:MAG: Hydrolase, NUDIX family [Parcubacteria group bacterium GW2011_GWA2_36_10]
MPEEYLDIIDENNNLTGAKKLRSEVHAKGYWHRTVHIYFFRFQNKEIEVLVHLRAKTKDLHPNCWDTRFGGHLKSGENIEMAVVGEIKEEVGLKINLSDLIKGPIRKRDNYPNNEFTHVYFYNFDRDLTELKFEDAEVQEIKWMKETSIVKNLTDNPNDWSDSLDGFKSVIKVLKNLG